MIMSRRFIVCFLMVLMAIAAFGQGTKKKAPTERSVSGIVSDADGKPIPSAVVQLKNLKTLQVRSFIAMEKGDYYFHGLSTDVDYEIKAQSEGKTSATRSISSFNSNPEITVDLQVK